VLSAVGAGLLWLLGLAAALWAAEQLVRALDDLGHRVHLTPALLGTLVAFGADGPEITSAILALANGSPNVSAGVLIGSNIYNLAGLLGLSAVLAGPLLIGPRRMAQEETLNTVLTALAVILLFVTPLHVVIGLLSIGLFAGYLYRIGHPIQTRKLDVEQSAVHPSRLRLGATLALSVLLILAASEALVRSSLYLAPLLGIPPSVVGTVILAVATSLPNTWAAVSLARHGRASAAVVATFGSNSINLVVGLAAPALVVMPHLAAVSRFDILWLASMTAVAVLMLAVRHALGRTEGITLLALYSIFLVVRLGFLS
jgi:cation:H+ antiporter